MVEENSNGSEEPPSKVKVNKAMKKIEAIIIEESNALNNGLKEKLKTKKFEVTEKSYYDMILKTPMGTVKIKPK